jgi:hypothetical protein
MLWYLYLAEFIISFENLTAEPALDPRVTIYMKTLTPVLAAFSSDPPHPSAMSS